MALKKRFTDEADGVTPQAGDVIVSDSLIRGSRRHDLTQFVRTTSPEFTGAPKAPTAALGNESTQIANTLFVATAIAQVLGAAPSALNTLNELAAALGGDPNFSTTIINLLAGKLDRAANLSDLQNVTLAKQNLSLHLVDNTSDAAKPVSAQQAAALATKAPLLSPAFTGNPTAPTCGSTENSDKLATTQFVQNAVADLAKKTPSDGLYRLKNGVELQIRNRSTGKYHSLIINGADGLEVLEIGVGED